MSNNISNLIRNIIAEQESKANSKPQDFDSPQTEIYSNDSTEQINNFPENGVSPTPPQPVPIIQTSPPVPSVITDQVSNTVLQSPDINTASIYQTIVLPSNASDSVSVSVTVEFDDVLSAEGYELRWVTA